MSGRLEVVVLHAADAERALEEDAVPRRVLRASTVALSETDLEEFEEGQPSFDLARAEVRARIARERAKRDTWAEEAERTSPNRVGES